MGSRHAQAAQSTDCIREDLFSPACGARRDESGERSRMLAANERVAKSTDRLNEAHAMTMDIEGTAASILNDLSRQREVMMRSKATIAQVGAQLEGGRRVLQTMARRAMANKLVLYLIMGLIGGIVLVTAWSSTAAPATPEPVATMSNAGNT